VPRFVEVKRASDTRARREVVAQMLDYAANGSVFWTPGQLRSWFEGDHQQCAMADLMGLLGSPEGEPSVMADDFWQAVGTNLREGRIRPVFIADEISASLQRLVEFLNEQMPRVEVLALEIRQYRAAHGSTGALVPRLVGQTARAQALKQPAAPTARRPARWTVDEVVESVMPAGPKPAAVAATVRDSATAHPRIQITGGTGVSDPSFTMAADVGEGTSPTQAVLSLYANRAGARPVLEIRIRRMCTTPPYDHDEARARLIVGLEALGIPLPTSPQRADRRAPRHPSQRADRRPHREPPVRHRPMDPRRPGPRREARNHSRNPANTGQLTNDPPAEPSSEARKQTTHASFSDATGLGERGSAPIYAPDLNPAEGVWTNMKNGRASSPSPNVGEGGRHRQEPAQADPVRPESCSPLGLSLVPSPASLKRLSASEMRAGSGDHRATAALGAESKTVIPTSPA
jgi:hypothetical protein